MDFDLTITSKMDRERLVGEMVVVAAKAGFDLIHLRPSDDGLLGRWSCLLRPAATIEATDDARILALLGELCGAIQWVAVKKEPLLDRPDVLSAILGRRAT